MSSVFREEPFPHFVFNDVFDQRTLAAVLGELGAIQKANILFPPVAKETSQSPDGTLRNTSTNIWLDEVYKRDRSNSAVITATEQFMRVDLFNEAKNIDHWFYANSLEISNFHGTLVNYYGDGSQYKSHRDYSSISLIFTFYQEPKSFRGGDINFPQYDLKIEALNNSVVVFPGFVVHEITPVEISSNDVNDGLSRFGVVVFISRQDR